jgi:hypothetical protein
MTREQRIHVLELVESSFPNQNIEAETLVEEPDQSNARDGAVPIAVTQLGQLDDSHAREPRNQRFEIAEIIGNRVDRPEWNAMFASTNRSRPAGREVALR